MSFETVVSATVFSAAVISAAAGVIGVTLSRATRQQSALKHAGELAQVIVEAEEFDGRSLRARRPTPDPDLAAGSGQLPIPQWLSPHDHRSPAPQQPETPVRTLPGPPVYASPPPTAYAPPPSSGRRFLPSRTKTPGSVPGQIKAAPPTRAHNPDRRTPSNVDNLQVRQYFDHIESAKSQSGIYFWTYLVSGLLGICVLLAAAAIALFGSRDVAIFTTICGALPTAISAMFYKRAGDLDTVVHDNLARLDKAVETAKRTKAAKEAASMLPVGQTRDRMLSLIAIRQMFPDASPAEIAILTSQDVAKVDP
ncbi:MAG: hypothetical protein JWN03_4715 [Nocardia sp.]|uniref:TRADD-N-associated membrane domain-containing protein n=1 Tax=Nocardia sp. TaxID=1821 RepID=UPI00262D935D|nr:hypothetical protein [Nocardia sp.]MCU1644440.1 hypothetical protein [Nocardia sp.]